ncbi:MarR family winged helix-turn-helix transcriptional regulator [Streptomyces lydicus]|uniref:MarR family winged helix-turn-helix transcriptional regulator n=1 Tax=Streptomyces lydicus TaxID=47763 RepID=UPI0036E5951D
MESECTDPGSLDFWSFIDFAIGRASNLVPGIDREAMRLVLTLHRTASMVVYDMESTVHRPRGLSWPGFRVLFAVWLASPLEAKRVAELTGMSRAAVSALLNTLAQDDLVLKERAVHDGRAVQVSLTERGEAAIAETFQAHNAREQDWASALTAEEQQTLIRLLGKINAGAGRIKAKQRM